MANGWVLDTSVIEPTVLTGVIRQALFDQQVNTFTLSRWLPNVDIDDITFKFASGGQGLAEAAVYRSWDTESRIGRREGVSQVMGELPPISEKIPLDEYDQLRLRKLDNPALLPFIARDAERLARNIGARFELARGDAIFNGSLTINENGVQQTVAFGRNAAHTVTASVLWSSYATATPLDDLESWVQTYSDDNGQLPGRILMSRTVLGHLRRCDQIKGQVFPLANASPMVNSEQVRTVFDSLDLPPYELYDAQVKVDGTSTRVTPVNKIALLPAPGAANAGQPTDFGGTLLGTTLESQEPEYGLAAGEQPGVVAAAYKSRDPIRLWTHAAAIGMPVLSEPDLSFVATVA